MGLKTNKISTQIDEKAISRAGAIADRAKQEDFGTIVMGRRGHSHVREFFIGRVTNKVIHIDLSESSIKMVPYVQTVAEKFESKIHILFAARVF